MQQLRRILSICFHLCGCSVSHICDSFFLIEFVMHSDMNGPPLAQELDVMLAGFPDGTTIAIYVPPAADWTDNAELEKNYHQQSVAIDGVRQSVRQSIEGPHQRTIMERAREHRKEVHADQDDWMDVRSESMNIYEHL